MHGQRGQSTVEYAALVLLALLVLTAAGAGLAASGIAGSVVAQMRRALCLVSGAGCPAPAEPPCVLAVRTHTTDVSARLSVLRLRGGRSVIRERRADGSERVTVLDRAGAGVGLATGVDAGIGGWSVAVRAGATVEGRSGAGRTWVVPNAAAGDALLRRLAPRPGTGRSPAPLPAARDAPEPDVTFGEHGLDTELEGRLGRIGLTLDAEDVLGTRTDRRTGTRTLAVRRRNDLAGGLGLFAELQGLGRREERYALTVDRAGRPLDLEIRETLRLQAGVRLPGPLRTVVGRTGLPVRAGRVWETERHLDLADPESLAAAAAFVRALRAPRLRLGDAVVVTGALRRRLAAVGTAQARVYGMTARVGGGHGGLDVLGGLGGAYETVDEALTLRAARVLGPDGRWRDRGDCGGLA